jgi:predicted RNase H-like HicB family nuclease
MGFFWTKNNWVCPETRWTAASGPVSHIKKNMEAFTMTPEAENMVLVRREDLEVSLKCADYGSESWDEVGIRVEAIDRLKAALAGETTAPEEYLKRPYHYILVWDEESQTWAGKVKELPGCLAQGESWAFTMVRLRSAALDWIAAALDLGQEIPGVEGDAGPEGGVTNEIL